MLDGCQYGHAYEHGGGQRDDPSHERLRRGVGEIVGEMGALEVSKRFEVS